MDLALLLARLLLAAVFALAGFAKLADLAGSRKGMAEFGVPAALAGPLGILLPLAELAIAAALILSRTAWWAAVGGLTVLLLFMLGILVTLSRGRRPDCRCFGQLHSAPIGASTLARNGLLAGIAGFIVWGGRESAGPSVLAWFGEGAETMQTGFAIFAVVVLGLLALEGWLLLLLLRQNGRLILRLDELESRVASGQPDRAFSTTDPDHAGRGLPIGSPAPAFSLPGLFGETLTLDALRARDRPVLLLFMDPTCGPCNALMPDVGHWGREHGDRLSIAVVSGGTPDANRAKATEHGITTVLLQQNYEVADSFDAYATPSAVLVRADGSIGSHVVSGPDAIRSLVSWAIADGAAAAQAGSPRLAYDGSPRNGVVQQGGPAGSSVGRPAPELKLPDLDGKPVNLAARSGRPTVLLFWNLGCGFCQQMLPRLKQWEASGRSDAPELIVVSTGSAEENRAMGLRSTVVLDEGFRAGNALAANGTPIGVLIDAEGRIGSPLAIGADAVMAILNGSERPGSSAASSQG